MRRYGPDLRRSEAGAVAPTVALALVALLACGGIAFDYARLVTLDTEQQQAADQAALAAASQLDGKANMILRATAAAQNLLSNELRFSNDAHADGFAASITQVKFYLTKADAEANNGNDCPTTNEVVSGAADESKVRFVCVRTRDRLAKYALTPVVAAFSSPNISAMAVAGLGTSICKVPPVMICNPNEPSGNTNASYPFDANSIKGFGMRLITVGNGPSAWAPGNFGYLDTNSPTANPNVELREALGWSTAPGDCSPLDGVETRTGAGTPVTQALNTRFDIYERANTGNGNAASCPTGSACPPSINTMKDVYQKGTPNAANKCGIANNEWEIPADSIAYRPSSNAALTSTERNAVKVMGHPRDMCHAVSLNGVCTYNSGTNTKIGDGVWDRDAYFQANYGWSDVNWPTYVATGVASAQITTATPTRYQVYNWEIANRGSVIGGRTILAANPWGSSPGANQETSHNQPVCSALQSPASNGVVPGGTNVDRRRISAAVLNCIAQDVHGGGPTVYPVLKWIELFLVEPSINRGSGGNQRTDPNDVYVEVIGETTVGNGPTAGQVVRRDVPYLVK